MVMDGQTDGPTDMTAYKDAFTWPMLLLRCPSRPMPSLGTIGPTVWTSMKDKETETSGLLYRFDTAFMQIVLF